MKKFPFLIGFFLVFVLIVSLVSCKPKTTRETNFTFTQQEKQISLYEKVGSPMDVILLLDQSGSMNGYNNEPPTDPKNLRIAASKYFINNLSRRSEIEPFLRISIVNFGTDVPKNNIMPLTTVTSKPDDQGIHLLTSSLKSLSLGYTSFIKALKVAYGQFTEYKTVKEKRKPIIIIFTDGEPADTRHLSMESYFKELQTYYNTYLKKINCETFVIGIDATGSTWAKTISYWEKIVPKDHVLGIENMDELFERYNEIIQKSFYLPVTTPDTFAKTLQFEVPPYLENIQFDIFPATKNIAVAIINAEGKKLSKENPNVYTTNYPTYKTIIVSDPIPGKWKYEIIKGQGEVKIYKTLIPNKMNLVSPSSRNALGRPFNITFAFLKSDNSVVRLQPEYPLNFSGKVISPTGIVTKLRFKKGEKGIYFTENEYNPEKEGKYRIILIATGREGFEIRNEYTINVEKTPYIVLNSPSNGTKFSGFRKNLNIEATLYYDKKALAPSKFFETDPNSLIWAQIVRLPTGKTAKEVVSLAPSPEEIGKFIGTIPVSLNRKGQYILKAELDAKTLSGERFKDTATSTFYVFPSFIDYLKIYWYLVLLLIIALLVAYLIWKGSLPQLQGYFYINGEEIPLEGYKMTIGDRNCNIILGDNVSGKIGFVKAVWGEKNEEGIRETLPEIHYKSSTESRKFDAEETLSDNSTVTILDKVIKYIRK